MSDPSPLVFELCTAIDRFYEREPDLSVSDVLAALDEVSMALAYKRARTHWSPANVVRISDYKRAAGLPGFTSNPEMQRRNDREF